MACPISSHCHTHKQRCPHMPCNTRNRLKASKGPGAHSYAKLQRGTGIGAQRHVKRRWDTEMQDPTPMGINMRNGVTH
eukprot:14302693-Alexandrium_andersonii.AAC.1